MADYEVSGLGYQPGGAITRVSAVSDADDERDLAPILAVASLCNDAHIVADAGEGDRADQWHLVGEPTEGALKVVALKGGADAAAPRIDVVPFDSANKLMATLNAAPGGSRAILVKGAPDRLLERSTTQRGAGGPMPVDADFWNEQIDVLSGQGLRVLAAARRIVDPGVDSVQLDDLAGLEFLGLWGIVDPPRPEAIEAIADCHRAGIRVKMITGDHAGTAVAISREMGLISRADAPVLNGTDLEALSQDQLKAVVRDVDVFARTSPEHKIRIVRALQSHGEVVAMTGDGVNDAPALTRADVVAMLALGQLAFLFNCRFLGRSSLTRAIVVGNPVVWWAALALVVLQLVYTYVPFMNGLFGSRPLMPASWLVPIVLSIVIFFAVEGLKALRNRTR